MKRRYSIWGTEYCSNHEVELAQVDRDPETVVEGFMQKKIAIGKKKIRKYTWLRIVENKQAS